MKKIFLILIILLGVYFIFTSVSEKTSISENIEPVAVTDEPITLVESSFDLTFLQNESTVKIDLNSVDESSSYGSAFILLEDDNLSHYVIADLPVPDDGSVYEGWIVNSATTSFFSTGVMVLDANGQFELFYSQELLEEGYDKVVITLETIVDETPEAHVLEGSF